MEVPAQNGGGNRTQRPMIRTWTRIMVPAFLGTCLIPAILFLYKSGNSGISPGFVLKAALLASAAVIATAGFYFAMRRLGPIIDANAAEQATFLDKPNPKYLDIAIAGAAALSLFLELAIIRWQSTIFVFFAFYKNFSLLACFVGLGLGYALATRDRIPLLLVLPLLAWQFAFMVIVRYVFDEATFRTLPFREQLSMGVGIGGFGRNCALYGLLTVVFVITALGFIPIGQLCGRLMERRKKLRAYGLNLLGSLLGVVMMLLASLLWTPPLVWFALCFLAILLLHLRTASSLIAGIVFTVFCCVVLAWPVNPLWNRVYSPYQLLEIGSDEQTGLTLIRAAGHYYQRIYDFSGEKLSKQVTAVRGYYDLPYRAYPHLSRVAVVGAGTGNDVAAALRAGGEYVDAIEIDPAILDRKSTRLNSSHANISY